MVVPHTFTFHSMYSYDTTKIGITVPVELSNGAKVVQIDAKLDTGASFSIFARTYGEMLGLTVESGAEEKVSTANGAFQVFGHWLTIDALGFRGEALVYFAADEQISRNVLGRRGFIDQLRLCLIEHDGVVYASKYDDE